MWEGDELHEKELPSGIRVEWRTVSLLADM